MSLIMISKFISQTCSSGDALIIVPPFGAIDRPSIGVHILQACAARAGLKVDILYCNLLLAKYIGIDLYEYICYAPTTGLIGERFFSRAAYNINAVSLYPNENNTGRIRTSTDTENLEGFIERYRESSDLAVSWIDEVIKSIPLTRYTVIGCSTTFEQTSCSVALIEKIKKYCSSVITIIGGANCEDEMANGIKTLSKFIDYVFSGESERTFPKFLTDISEGNFPEEKIIKGQPIEYLSEIPLIDYKDYYSQLSLLDINKKELPEIWLPYESSRGCWWGQKRHCLFCGINGQGIKYREKTSDQVERELDILMKDHPNNNVCMVDNIMPLSYFKTLLPELASKNKKYHFFYEQKANLRLDQLELLKKAGVNLIQPGIESLSSPLLKLMNKGVSAYQNISLLRYARMTNVFVNWNILHSFPSDSIQWYIDIFNIIKKISHLAPPTGTYGLSIDRFSPYFDRAEYYSISNIRPIYSYNEVFPKESEIEKIAYHFEADYHSDSREHADILDDIEVEVSRWRDAWSKSDQIPVLHINMLKDDVYLLVDTRINSNKRKQFVFINKKQACACLFGRVINNYDNSIVSWAINENYCVVEDGKIIPLSTANINLFKKIEQEIKNQKYFVSDL